LRVFVLDELQIFSVLSANSVPAVPLCISQAGKVLASPFLPASQQCHFLHVLAPTAVEDSCVQPPSSATGGCPKQASN
jgi:hypothetical protein